MFVCNLIICVVYCLVKVIECKFIIVVILKFLLIFFKLFNICFVVSGFNDVIGLFVNMIFVFCVNVLVIDICCCCFFDNLLVCVYVFFKIFIFFNVWNVSFIFFFGNKFNVVCNVEWYLIWLVNIFFNIVDCFIRLKFWKIILIFWCICRKFFFFVVVIDLYLIMILFFVILWRWFIDFRSVDFLVLDSFIIIINLFFWIFKFILFNFFVLFGYILEIFWNFIIYFIYFLCI